jgi:hypothetical protein
MSSTKREHYFLPGRKSKNGGPGILVVEGQYKFRKNKANKEKNKFIMYCVQQNNPEFGCKARAVVAPSRAMTAPSLCIHVMDIITILSTGQRLQLRS